MKKTLYWSVSSNGHTHYYFDKEQMINDWGNAKRLFENIELFKVNFYSLETEITDEIILLLLNNEFSHCRLPNYHNAVLLVLSKVE